MSGDTGVQLRRLVARPVDLPRPAPGKSAGTHPLGLNMPRGVQYTGAIPLPNIEDGLRNLGAVVAATPPNVPDAVREIMWGALLNKPPLQVALGPPTVEGLLGLDVPASERTIGLFRQVGLAVVMNLDPSIGGVARPIAGVGVLTVRLNDRNRRSADDAWLQAQWPTSTRALAHELERFIRLGGAPPQGRKRAALLISPQFTDHWGEDAVTRVQTTATVFGYDLTVYDRSNVTFGSVRTALERSSPSLVVSFGPDDGELPELRAAYEKAASGGRFLALAPTSTDEAVQQMREHLALVVGVNASMSPMDNPALTPVRVPFPIESAVECRHDGANRPYLCEEGTGLWWTRDTAGHGGIVFKTYRREAELLIHEADRDADGAPVPGKFKGVDGRQIPVSGLSGCSHPQTHLDSR